METTTREANALQLAAEGYAVFPLGPLRKTPLVRRGVFEATRDENRIREWWSQWPEANVGIATGAASGVVVLDVDAKHGKPGLDTLAELDLVYGVPPTRTVTTPSGGLHLYFTTVNGASYGNSARNFGDGIDVRAEGGYVVAPGSSLPAGDYVLRTDHPTASPLPEWLADKLCEPRSKPKDRDNALNDIWDAAIDHLDSPRTISDVRSYLQQSAPTAEQGNNGNDATYKTACECRDRGATELMTLQLMLDHWNETKATPPWDYNELADVVSNAYRYAAEPLGNRSIEAAFDVVQLDDDPTPEQTKGERFTLRRAADARIPTAPVHLVKGMIDVETMTVLYGPSGSGKTFVTLQLAYAVATGNQFLGRDTRKGIVVYLSLEGGQRSFDPRVVAQIQEQGPDTDDNFWYMTVPARLVGNDNDTEALAHAVARCVGRDRVKDVSLVVVDTLSRAMAGENENAAEVMTSFVGQVDRLRHTLDAAIIVVHHTGKDAAKGGRGHSSLRAATDTELEVENGEWGRTLRATKQRSMELAGPWAFDLKQVVVGHDDEGDAVRTCVVVGGFDRVPTVGGEPVGDAETCAEMVLRVILQMGPGDHGRESVLAAIHHANGERGEPFRKLLVDDGRGDPGEKIWCGAVSQLRGRVAVKEALRFVRATDSDERVRVIQKANRIQGVTVLPWAALA